MTQILLIGGPFDGEIREDHFLEYKNLRVTKPTSVSSVSALRRDSNSATSHVKECYHNYNMISVRIEGKSYACATAKTINEHEILDLVKKAANESGFKPIE
ncbi:hypothetical protein PMPD1_3144 [Paramixta manurensis]|uniref:Uncharacterized protein n=1 Tax=Paramixta manurensis TaxID=2740817 RepID=A0A6M8UER2_9GAMM|nr:hypothetical protein PMPD1_2520 [Erwiniaceae bacterium PD-1]QKJ88074.1 hypothetical protein PMPD1_3144 [Erwiniaceae bacterium PD-1]